MLPRPETVAEVQAAVRASPCLRPRGGGTKPALSMPPAGAVALDVSALSGMLEYEPSEFTFTALAGTRLSAVEARLAEHGQYLPFDPPLVERGATLGGTVAAGLSGPGRHRYGAVRDFILGVRYVDGAGEVVRAGGQVVKNAAGFDLPKLMVGSLGQLGVLVELSFKVFPRPRAYVTVARAGLAPEEALAAMLRLYGAPLDVDALDLTPERDGLAVWARLGGLPEALPARAERVRGVLGGGQVVEGPAELELWHAARELTWAPAGWCLAKVALTPRQVLALEAALAPGPALRRYSAAGNLGWVATPEAHLPALGAALDGLGLAGRLLFGPPAQSRLGRHTGLSFGQRVRRALDPGGRFAVAVGE